MNKASRANISMQRRDTEAGMVENLSSSRYHRIFLSDCSRRGDRCRSMTCMCRKSIFVSFRIGRITVKPQKPGYICREEIPRWVWWLHIILVVVGDTSCGMEEMAQSEKLQANPACGQSVARLAFAISYWTCSTGWRDATFGPRA